MSRLACGRSSIRHHHCHHHHNHNQQKLGGRVLQQHAQPQQAVLLLALHHRPAQPRRGTATATHHASKAGQQQQQRSAQLPHQQAAVDTLSQEGDPAGGSWTNSSGLLPWPDGASPDSLDSQQQLVCDVLRVSPADARLLLFSCQAANELSRQQLADNWELLQQLLPVQKQQLLQALLRLPDLLQHPREAIQARLGDAAAVLQLPVQQLLSQRRRRSPQLRYQLLLMSQPQLEARVEQLTRVLAVKRSMVVQLVCGEPQLLLAGQAQLISTVEALEQVCGLRLERLASRLLRQPQLLVAPAEQLYQAAAALQQQLRLSEEGLALALRRAPGALGVPAQRVDQLLQELSLALAVSPDVAADILLQEPELLLCQPGAVAAVLGLLRSTFRLDAESLLQVVQFDPFVLGASPGDLEASTGKFKQLAGRHKAWTLEYGRLMSRPVNVARALRIEPLRLQRLQYLTQQRMAATISLKAALTMSGRQFVLAYPRYSSWLAERYSRGNVPRQYRWQQGRRGDSDDDEDDDDDA